MKVLHKQIEAEFPKIRHNNSHKFSEQIVMKSSPLVNWHLVCFALIFLCNLSNGREDFDYLQQLRKQIGDWEFARQYIGVYRLQLLRYEDPKGHIFTDYKCDDRLCRVKLNMTCIFHSKREYTISNQMTPPHDLTGTIDFPNTSVHGLEDIPIPIRTFQYVLKIEVLKQASNSYKKMETFTGYGPIGALPHHWETFSFSHLRQSDIVKLYYKMKMECAPYRSGKNCDLCIHPRIHGMQTGTCRSDSTKVCYPGWSGDDCLTEDLEYGGFRGRLMFRLDKYNDESGRDINEEYCDYQTIGYECETFFRVKVNVGEWEMNMATEPAYLRNHRLLIPKKRGRNSLYIGLPGSKGDWKTASLQIKVFDNDTHKLSNDLLREYNEAIDLSSITKSWITKTVTLWTRNRSYSSKLTYSYKFACDRFVYGKVCNKWCRSQIKFTCNKDGDRVCNEHYYPRGNCTRYCFPSDHLSDGHYTCSVNGSKDCLPGWAGETCLKVDPNFPRSRGKFLIRLDTYYDDSRRDYKFDYCDSRRKLNCDYYFKINVKIGYQSNGLFTRVYHTDKYHFLDLQNEHDFPLNVVLPVTKTDIELEIKIMDDDVTPDHNDLMRKLKKKIGFRSQDLTTSWTTETVKFKTLGDDLSFFRYSYKLKCEEGFEGEFCTKCNQSKKDSAPCKFSKQNVDEEIVKPSDDQRKLDIILNNTRKRKRFPPVTVEKYGPSRGKFIFQFLEYKNYYMLRNDGETCDFWSREHCEIFFEVSLKIGRKKFKLRTAVKSIPPLRNRRTEFEILNPHNKFRFYLEIPTTSKFDNIPFTIRVLDDDGDDDPQLMETYHAAAWFVKPSPARFYYYYNNKNKEYEYNRLLLMSFDNYLSYGYKVVCYPPFGGIFCTERCLPKKADQHYTCTEDGKVKCDLYYFPPNRCNIYCKPEKNRYACTNAGKKRCYPKWTGEDCKKAIN